MSEEKVIFVQSGPFWNWEIPEEVEGLRPFHTKKGAKADYRRMCKIMAERWEEMKNAPK